MAKDYSDRKTKKDIIDSDFYFAGRLEDMIAELQDILDRHPGKVIMVDYESVTDNDGWYSETGYKHTIYIERIENDEEYVERKRSEVEQQKLREEAERKKFEELKKKYG